MNYCIAGKFGYFNLAVWQITKHPPILVFPIIKHDVIRNTHMHNSLSAYAHILRDTWSTTALLRITATVYGSSLFVVFCTQFNSSPTVGSKVFCKCGGPKHSFQPVMSSFLLDPDLAPYLFSASLD